MGGRRDKEEGGRGEGRGEVGRRGKRGWEREGGVRERRREREERVKEESRGEGGR